MPLASISFAWSVTSVGWYRASQRPYAKPSGPKMTASFRYRISNSSIVLKAPAEPCVYVVYSLYQSEKTRTCQRTEGLRA
jgi:hypothetical protein